MNDDHGGMCADGTHVASHIDLSGLEIGATYFLEVRAYSSNVGEYEISLECPSDTTAELTTAIPETTEVPTGWTPISESLACEANDEGISRIFGSAGFNFETCKTRCLETSGCKAIDYFQESGWCNLFGEACSTPRKSIAGASSWKLI